MSTEDLEEAQARTDRTRTLSRWWMNLGLLLSFIDVIFERIPMTWRNRADHTLIVRAGFTAVSAILRFVACMAFWLLLWFALLALFSFLCWLWTPFRRKRT